MTLAEEIQHVYDLVSEIPVTGNPEAIKSAILHRSGLLARVSQMVPQAKHDLIMAQGETAHLIAERKLTQDREKREIEFLTASEMRLLDLAERLWKTIHIQIEAMRSNLSYEKESMRL